jgi:hypothetical protein
MTPAVAARVARSNERLAEALTHGDANGTNPWFRHPGGDAGGGDRDRRRWRRPRGDYPGHIHAGSCEELGDVVFPLGNASVGGMMMGMMGGTPEADMSMEMGEEMGPRRGSRWPPA